MKKWKCGLTSWMGNLTFLCKWDLKFKRVLVNLIINYLPTLQCKARLFQRVMVLVISPFKLPKFYNRFVERISYQR